MAYLTPQVYTESLHRLYEKELADFFELARQALIGNKGKATEGKKNPAKTPEVRRHGSKDKVPTMHELVSAFKGGDSDLTDHQRFDMVRGGWG